MINIKQDFSFFKNNLDFVYLDTAATSQTPDVVLETMSEYYKKYKSNIHRGLYPQSEWVTGEYEKTREKIAKFIGAEKDEVIFTAGATMSSNVLVYMLEQNNNFQEDDQIIVSSMEHHSSLLPLQELSKRNKMVLNAISINKDYEFNFKHFEELLDLFGDKVKIVSVMLASNVTGAINDVKKISELAHKKNKNIIVISDITAGIGHFSVDIKDLGVDFAFFSGHKMCGPTGVGVLYGKKEKLENLAPGFFGGGMIGAVNCCTATYATDISKFEAGTPNIAGVLGLGKAVEYLDKIGLEKIKEHTDEIIEYAEKELQKIEGVKIFAVLDKKKNIGTISFSVNAIHAHDIAQIAGDNGVAIRAGHHCAMLLTKELGVPALSRASFYLYTTEEDIDKLVEVIKKAQGVFG